MTAGSKLPDDFSLCQRRLAVSAGPPLSPPMISYPPPGKHQLVHIVAGIQEQQEGKPQYASTSQASVSHLLLFRWQGKSHGQAQTRVEEHFHRE